MDNTHDLFISTVLQIIFTKYLKKLVYIIYMRTSKIGTGKLGPLLK